MVQVDNLAKAKKKKRRETCTGKFRAEGEIGTILVSEFLFQRKENNRLMKFFMQSENHSADGYCC